MPAKIDLYLPAQGEIITLEEVNHYLLEQEVGGSGVGIIPRQDVFYAPVSGKVVLVGEHANHVAIEVNENITVLIHCGIHTDALEGRGFSSYVREGDEVILGDKILYMDRDFIASHGDATVLVLLTKKIGLSRFIVDYSAQRLLERFMEIHLK